MRGGSPGGLVVKNPLPNAKNGFPGAKGQLSLQGATRELMSHNYWAHVL